MDYTIPHTLEEQNQRVGQENADDNASVERGAWPEPCTIDRNGSFEKIFSAYYKKLDKNFLETIIASKKDHTKNLAVSVHYHEMGNRSFAEGNYMQALYYFNGSLIYSPPQHEIFGLTLERRSETFFRLEKYKECLSDIEVIPTTKYPKNHYYKIYIRKCCVYRNLAEYLSAWKALEEAAEAFKNISSRNIPDDIKDIQQKLIGLENDLRRELEAEEDSTEEITYSYERSYDIPPLFKGTNETFLNASNAVTLMENNRIGRFVVATESITPGVVLFIEEPYATSYTFPENHLTFFCSNCLESVAAFLPCNGCLEACFCSLKCKEFYWNTRHRWECFGIRKQLFNPIMSLALAILFKASFTNFRRQTTEGVFGDKSDNYPYLRTLVIKKEKVPCKKFKAYLKMTCWMVSYLKTHTNFFWWLKNMNPRLWGSTKAMHRFIGGLLLKHLLQIDFNSDKIGDYIPGSSQYFQQGVTYEYKTLALYVSTRMIRHACLPNAVVSYQGLKKVVQATRYIQPGEEITVSYISKKFELENFEIPFKSTICNAYLRRNSIDCECLSCNDKRLYRSLFPWKCVKCSNYSVSNDTYTKATCISCKHEFDLNIHRMIEKFLEKEFDQLKERQYDEHDLQVFEKRMKNIYHSTNINFIYLYSHYIHLYECNEQYSKIITYIKKMANLRATWFGYNDPIFASYMAYLTIVYVKMYCNLAKNIDVYNRAVHIRIREEIILVLNITLTCFQDHMSPENLSAFETIVMAILDSTKYIDSSQIDNLIYYACSQTPVLIKLFEPDLIFDDIPKNIPDNIDNPDNVSGNNSTNNSDENESSENNDSFDYDGDNSEENSEENVSEENHSDVNNSEENHLEVNNPEENHSEVNNPEENHLEVNNSEENHSQVNNFEEKNLEVDNSKNSNLEEKHYEADNSEENDSEENISEVNNSEEKDSADNNSEENHSEENKSKENYSEETHFEKNR